MDNFLIQTQNPPTQETQMKAPSTFVDFVFIVFIAIFASAMWGYISAKEPQANPTQVPLAPTEIPVSPEVTP